MKDNFDLKIRLSNARIVNLASVFLNFCENSVSKEDLLSISDSCHISLEEAYAEMFAAMSNVGSDPSEREFVQCYIKPMFHLLSTESFTYDDYYKNIKFKPAIKNNFEVKIESLTPCQPFVCNDFCTDNFGRMIPQIGFFMEKYQFPAILENGREWMTLLPNETITTRPAIENSNGKVLTYGLGLGYFAYHASNKNNVSSITIVEKEQSVIDIFESEILPQFPNKEKINVICTDAFDYAEHIAGKCNYDYIFADIWHDVGDGREMYLKLKSFENKCSCAKFDYWLEKSILMYLHKEYWP